MTPNSSTFNTVLHFDQSSTFWWGFFYEMLELRTRQSDAMQDKANRLALSVYRMCDAVNWETPTREGSSYLPYLLRDRGQLPRQRDKSALSDVKWQKRCTICPLSKCDPQQKQIISRCVSRISRCVGFWNTYVWEITLMMPPQIVV